MKPVKLYLLHFLNINKFYDTIVDKKRELASRIPGCASISSKFLLNCLWVVVALFEPFISIIIVTGLLPCYICKALKKKEKEDFGKNVALCYHGLAKQRLESTNEVLSKVDYCLYPLNVDKGWLIGRFNHHCVFDLVGCWDVIKAYFWTLIGIIAANIKTHGKYVYRNYLCFEFVLTYYSLKRIPLDSTLYFVNHIDRWAVLFNNAPQQKKVLLQHGIERPDADWPVKLTNVSEAYIFAESQKERIVAAVLGHTPEFKIMPPTIKLSEMDTSKKYNVVIVAGENYSLIENEEYIIKNLVRDDLMIYVKIHPGKNDFQNYLDLRKKYNPNVEVINMPTFPAANAVVSYYSTLGIEYEAHNIPVFYYDHNSLEEICGGINEICG